MSQEPPLVSVVMISFNHAQYLRETINSVLSQSMGNLELIFVDNNSTDNTQEIIKEIKDPRFIPCWQENLGVSLATNLGIEKARGAFIAIASADDAWYPEKLAKQLAALEKSGAGVSFTNVEYIGDDGIRVDPPVHQAPGLANSASSTDSRIESPGLFFAEQLPRHELFARLFWKSNFLCATSALVKRKFLPELGFNPSLIQLQDFEMWVRLIKKTDFSILPEKLVGYRVRGDGQNLSMDQRNANRVHFELNLVYRHFFEDLDPALFVQSFAKQFKGSNLLEEKKASQSTGLQSSASLSISDIHFNFEQAFLFLQKQESAIKQIGIEKLYSLMNTEAGRVTANRDYSLLITDVWDLARLPLFARDFCKYQEGNSAGDYVGEDALGLLERLRAQEKELDESRNTIRHLTSGKMWKLRNGVYSILRKLSGPNT